MEIGTFTYPKYPDPSKAWRHFEDQKHLCKKQVQILPLEGPSVILWVHFTYILLKVIYHIIHGSYQCLYLYPPKNQRMSTLKRDHELKGNESSEATINFQGILGCPWNLYSNYLVSWVVTYLGDLQPTCIGVIICLLSSMDILV